MRPDLEENVHKALRLLLIEKFSGNTTSLAKALRRSQSAMSQLLAGKNAPSYETAERVAVLMGQTVAQLFGQEGGAAEGGVLANLPNLVEAVAYVREKGRVTDQAIAAVCSAAGFLPDLDVEAWIALLVQVERHRPRAFIATAQPRTREKKRKAAGA